MTSSRQDAWTQDEDLLLAEIVLRHIREGGTQLAAFEEVGKKLSRTSAACGFRWNSFVRKQYKTGIDIAKIQRKQLKSRVITKDEEQPVRFSYIDGQSITSLSEVIRYLESIEQIQQQSSELLEANEELQYKLEQLQEKVTVLEKEKKVLESNLYTVEEDYKALIEIMERARKMVVLKEDEKSRKVKFQMEKNGNLERVENK
ncbi:RsfA family transcriptional regulator [Priestia flexa]|uniref:RsfA family transcriptional regulator n=1 Tax=Priestia flexa TaxID=86664 RepID=A0A8I1SLT3_9BACI|nr:RsfA family transcriptional regulator [Priestia flexa]MBN8250190.1 RsfA family transcriptional regulator [Priestia flexa]UIR29103.1 RsfA family transcriptional regulator [Priestia flexa]